MPAWEVKLRALRPRYARTPQEQFDERLANYLVPGMSILDVGGGRAPLLKPAERPAGTHYAGLDIDASLMAEAGTYDEMIESDICKFQPELEGRFDLIVCWQVLEHVKPLEAAFENMYRYLKPGGVMLTQFSGTWSVFGVLNRLLPHWLAVRALKLNGRRPRTVFPAYYHHCWIDRIEQALAPWAEPEVTPIYHGAVYFGFSHKLRRLYLLYEDWTTRHPRLASYYRVIARRPALAPVGELSGAAGGQTVQASN